MIFGQGVFYYDIKVSTVNSTPISALYQTISQIKKGLGL